MLVLLPLTGFQSRELKLCSLNITPLWQYLYDNDDNDDDEDEDEGSECFLTLNMHRDFNPLRKR